MNPLVPSSSQRPGSAPGPSEWFTGTAWILPNAVPGPPSVPRVSQVRFEPGARTVWHRHPLGQVLHVTAGSGLVQRAAR